LHEKVLRSVCLDARVPGLLGGVSLQHLGVGWGLSSAPLEMLTLNSPEKFQGFAPTQNELQGYVRKDRCSK
jgi:hypothetical protein